MDFLGSVRAGGRSAPRLGVQLFRGRSGPDSSPLDAPFTQTPPPPQLSSPPPRPPRPPRRLPRLDRKLLGGFLGLAAAIVGVALLSQLAVGGSAYWDHNMRGNADYGQGDWNGAVTEYGQMIALDPRREDGYNLRGMAYFKLKEFRPCAADYRAAAARTADGQSRAVMLQGVAYAEDYYGDHRQAIRDFTESIRLDPTIPDQAGETADAHDDTGSSVKGRMWAYYESGQYPQALADCQALIAVHPYPSSIAVRGKIYRKMGRYDLALADFRTALQEDPQALFAEDQLQGLLGDTGQYAAAASVAEAAAQANPGEAIPPLQVGWWQYRAGDLAEAIATDKQAISMHGAQPIVLYNLALACASQGDWGAAEPYLAQAVRVSSPSERHGALVDFQRALLQQPQSAALRQALAMLRKGRSA